MTDAVAQQPATLALTPENYRAILAKPLRVLPPAVRPAGLKLWTCYRHLPGLDSPLSLAAMLAVWVADWGLTEAGAGAIVHAMTDPARMAEVKFASDLTALLAAAAKAEIAAERKRVRDAEEKAFRASLPVPKPATPEEIRALRDSINRVGVTT